MLFFLLDVIFYPQTDINQKYPALLSQSGCKDNAFIPAFPNN
jgi:hypothetical protein